MQQRELVFGFSKLKDLLIRMYKIDRDRSLVKLYFSEKDDVLLMHDYDDHKKYLALSLSISNKDIRTGLTGDSYNLVEESLRQPNPTEFLNIGFKLNGFFRF